jgi:hypothetical protein
MFWYDLLFPPAMIVSPAVMCWMIPSAKDESLVNRRRLDRLWLAMWGITALGLAVFAALYLGIGPHVSRHLWPLCFAGFAMSFPLLAAKNPHLMTSGAAPSVRTARLVSRRESSVVSPRLLWLPWLIWGAGLLGVLGRLFLPFEAGAAWMAWGGGMLWVVLGSFSPWISRKTLAWILQEAEPMDAACSPELAKAYEQHRAFRSWTMFTLFGLISPLFTSVVAMTFAWTSLSQESLPLVIGVGAGGGTLVGVLGAALGILSGVKRARISALLAELERGGSGRPRPDWSHP